MGVEIGCRIPSSCLSSKGTEGEEDAAPIDSINYPLIYTFLILVIDSSIYQIKRRLTRGEISVSIEKKEFSMTRIVLMLLAFTQLVGVEITPFVKNIQVNGKDAKVWGLKQPDGTLGLRAKKGEAFDVVLKNTMDVPTSIHWHGLILPNPQDGVAFITQLPLYPGQAYHYHFPLVQSGTYWMHSHYGLQEQNMLSAPLIISRPDEEKMQEVIMFLADFSFTPAAEIYQKLRSSKTMGAMKMNTPDLVEVDYDAFLSNYATLDHPEIVSVEPGKKVRLRIINGGSATNFFLSLGSLEGEAIAVDGSPIQPLKGNQFELAVAQRIDIVVTIPENGGAFPILAQGEGTDKQTGLILATATVPLPKFSPKASKKAGGLTNAQEGMLRALHPLASKPVDKSLTLELGGNMADYVWTMNGQAWPEVTPLIVEKGNRIEIIFKNVTSMSHPMHLHGHVFQVTAIDGKPFQGAIRDTVLVMPNSSVTIQFDADNPGVWPLHCHILYHLEAGMLTVVRYKDFIQSFVKVENE